MENSVTATAKLFTHWRSQAVRLPVRVTKVGHRVILEPMEPDEPCLGRRSINWATCRSCRRIANSPRRLPTGISGTILIAIMPPYDCRCFELGMQPKDRRGIPPS